MPAPSKVVHDASQAMSIKYNNIVYEMRQRGTDVIVLSLGEAYFDVPLLPMEDLPFPALYHYSHSRGVADLRDRIAEYYGSRFGVPVDPHRELVVTAGSKAAIHFTLMSTLDPGDEVVIHEPTWVSYPEQVKLCYGRPVMMPYDKTVQDYERYLTDRTKLIILNNPHNPRGQVLTKNELTYLVDLARSNDVYLLADEAYSDFVLDGSFISAGAVDPEKRNVIVCNSISKNFGISGWRLGYSIANPELTEEILKVNQHVLTCPATILQYYVAKHFGWIEQQCKPQIAAVAEKRRSVAALLEQNGLRALRGGSTFYFFVSIAPTKLGSEEFCLKLLEQDHVCVVPGKGYGDSCDAFVRVSFGTEPLDRIDHGLQRMKRLIDATA